MSHGPRRDAPSQHGSQTSQAIAYGEEVGIMLEVQFMVEDIVAKLNQASALNSKIDLPPSERTPMVFNSVIGRTADFLRNAWHIVEEAHGPDSSEKSWRSGPKEMCYSHQSHIFQNEYPPHCPERPHVNYHTHNLGMPYTPSAGHCSCDILVQQHGHPPCRPYSEPHMSCVPCIPHPQTHACSQYHQPEQSPPPPHAYHAGQHDSQAHSSSRDVSVQAGIPQDQGSQVYQAIAYGEGVGIMLEVQFMAEDIVAKLNQASALNSTIDLPLSERTLAVFNSIGGRIIHFMKKALHILQEAHLRGSSGRSLTPGPKAQCYRYQSHTSQNEHSPHCAGGRPHGHHHKHNVVLPYMPIAAQCANHVIVRQDEHSPGYPYSDPHMSCAPCVPHSQTHAYTQFHQPEQSSPPTDARYAGKQDSQAHNPFEGVSVKTGNPQYQGI